MKIKTKETPIKSWEIVEDVFNERPEIRDSTGRLIAVVMRHYPMSEKTRTDNAMLISAAPELYDALKYIEWRGVGNECPFCENIRGNGHADWCELALALSKAEV